MRVYEATSVLRAETHIAAAVHHSSLKVLTGHSSSKCKNVESFSGTQVYPGKKSSVCSKENYWFLCSLNGGNVLSQCSRAQVGFLSVLAAVCLSLCLLFAQAACSLSWFASIWLDTFYFCSAEVHLKHISNPAATEPVYIYGHCYFFVRQLWKV